MLAKMKNNPGIRITPKTVPKNMHPAAAVPMDLLPIAPAPEAIASGIRPAINAKEVIRIGLKRCVAPSMVASRTDLPSFILRLANSTISMAFFPSKPISITKETCAKILFSKPVMYKKKNEPAIPVGKDRITGRGSKKLSY